MMMGRKSVEKRMMVMWDSVSNRHCRFRFAMPGFVITYDGDPVAQLRYLPVTPCVGHESQDKRMRVIKGSGFI